MQDDDDDNEDDEAQYGSPLCLSSSYYNVFVVRLAIMVRYALFVRLLPAKHSKRAHLSHVCFISATGYAGDFERLANFTHMAHHTSLHYKITKHISIRPSARASTTPDSAHVEHPQLDR